MVLDEYGNVIDELAERNEEIKASLQEVLQEFLDEKTAMMSSKRPPKLGYRFAKQMFSVLARYGQMTADEFVNLTYEDIEDAWLKFSELTAYYNRYFEIVDNKQLFCAFARINARQYAQLENHDDEDIRDLMNTINTSFIGLAFMAAESGNADVKGTTQRIKSSGEAGHGVTSAVEQKVLENAAMPSVADMSRRLEAITGIKLIED
jgi:hypothetical protein